MLKTTQEACKCKEECMLWAKFVAEQTTSLYLSFSSFLSGVWSSVSFRALPLRHSMARLSPTLPTTSSMPSLSRATVEVVPALIPGATETKKETWEAEWATEKRSTQKVCSQEPHSVSQSLTYTSYDMNTWVGSHEVGNCSKLEVTHLKVEDWQSHMQVALFQSQGRELNVEQN